MGRTKQERGIPALSTRHFDPRIFARGFSRAASRVRLLARQSLRVVLAAPRARSRLAILIVSDPG
jgi:hypothetical protein